MIYRLYDRSSKIDTWKFIDGVNLQNKSCVLQRDFNIVLKENFKLGGRDVDFASSNDFDSCLLRNDLSL